MVFRHPSRQEVLIDKQILLYSYGYNSYHLPKPILCDSLSKKKDKMVKCLIYRFPFTNINKSINSFGHTIHVVKVWHWNDSSFKSH